MTNQFKHRIAFSEIEWNNKAIGVREKAVIRQGKTIRIVEFSYGFNEKDWCTKGHVGYVLKGPLHVDFDGKMISYFEGDGIYIEEGIQSRHKVCMKPNEKALLILFEE